VSFAAPAALAALVVLPLLLGLYLVRERRRRAWAARFGNPALLPNVVDRSPGWRRHLPLVLLLVALAALIVGVARPHAQVTVKREQATVIVAIDVSRSMGATDVRPSRLAAARAAAQDFIAKVPSRYRVGIIAFGSRANVLLPPTLDRDLVAPALATLKPGNGTALGDAIALAIGLGKQQRARDGFVPPTSVLVLSDGAQQGGRVPLRTAERQAKTAHVPVSALAIGTANGTVKAKLTGGLTEIINVPADPAALRSLAAATGGDAFTSSSDSGLKHVYEKLGSRLGHRRQPRELTDAFAAGGGVLMLLGAAFSAFWFRRIP
jgi:Ca-activated chloride channel family protein